MTIKLIILYFIVKSEAPMQNGIHVYTCKPNAGEVDYTVFTHKKYCEGDTIWYKGR